MPQSKEVKGCVRLPKYPWDCRLELDKEWYKITMEVKPTSAMHLDIFSYLTQQLDEQEIDGMLVSYVTMERDK